MKFKIGDKVKIRKDVTLEEISNNHFNGCQYDTMCFLLQTSYHDFKYEYRIRNIIGNAVLIFTNNSYYYVNTIILEETEDNETILDNKEKEYLLSFIKPFRDEVAFISKFPLANKRDELICIHFKNGEEIYLPSYKKKTMYINMKYWVLYSLEELGL